MENVNIITIFLTGLFTGGLTCMAVQGGLLATTIAQRQGERVKREAVRTGSALPIISFLVAKLVAYTILGVMLGWLGSLFQLSLSAQVILQFTVAIFMIGTALNLLNIHPIFRYFAIQPPKFLTRRIRNQAKSGDLFAPAVLGAFTIFIPCGTTQAMMALAIASGNPAIGATILFAFVLGTSPVFFLLGYFATKLGDVLQARFMKVAAYSIIALAFWSFNSAIALAGSPYTLQSAWENVFCTVSFCDSSPVFANANGFVAGAAVSQATITIDQQGYKPNNIAVRAGLPVTLTLVNSSGGGCTQAFTIPSLGIQKIVPIGSKETITFTAPSQPGELAFMCSMGMFRGTIKII